MVSSQLVSGKCWLSPSTNFKFSGGRLQLAQFGSVVSTGLFTQGYGGGVMKYKHSFQTQHSHWEREFLEEGSYRLGITPKDGSNSSIASHFEPLCNKQGECKQTNGWECSIWVMYVWIYLRICHRTLITQGDNKKLHTDGTRMSWGDRKQWTFWHRKCSSNTLTSAKVLSEAISESCLDNAPACELHVRHDSRKP